MALPHTGSWGTWDLGLTELASKLLGEKLTSQGGSDLSRSWANTTTQTSPNLTPLQPYGPATTTTRPTSPTITTQNPSGQVLGGSTENPQQQPQGQPSYDYTAEINSIFNPTYSALQQQEQALMGQKQTAIDTLTEQSRQLQEALDTNVGQVNKDVEKNKQELYQGRSSALDQARRAYNASLQQGRSNLGAGSSAGAAVSEIIGQEYQRGHADIEKAYANNMGAIVDYSQRVQEMAFQQAQNIQKEHGLGLKSISDEFASRMASIAMDRASLESAKAQMRMDLLREAQARSQQLAAARDSALFELQTWSQKQKAMVNQSITEVNNQYKQMLMDQAQNRQTATTAPEISSMNDTGASKLYDSIYKNPFKSDDQETSNIFSPEQYFA